MRRRNLFNRREFLKTIAAGMGLSAIGSASLLHAIKSVASRAKLPSPNPGRGYLPVGEDCCKTCEKCLACPPVSRNAPCPCKTAAMRKTTDFSTLGSLAERGVTGPANRKCTGPHAFSAR